MLLESLALSICAPGPRDNCVVDGDTFWVAGEKVRIENIDAPETDQAKCSAERELGERAKHRLVTLLNAGTPQIKRTGSDRYGRTLARVMVDGRDVGGQLVREGLARPYAGGRQPWC